jgi:hypothetical protein
MELMHISPSRLWLATFALVSAMFALPTNDLALSLLIGVADDGSIAYGPRPLKEKKTDGY